MVFADNGKGMDPVKLEALLDGRTHKDKDSSRGSYGVGHFAAYYLSSLQYVLYASRYAENKTLYTLYTGSPILAGHHDGYAQRGSTGRIVGVVPDNEKNPEYQYPSDLTKFPRFIQKNLGMEGTGTIVAILGLSEDWNKDAEYAIASHFFSAIAHDALEITVHQSGYKPQKLDANRVEKLLKDNNEELIARGDGKILSGRDAWQSWLAVNNSKMETIQLSNNDKVNIYLKTTEVDYACIALIRSNMLVARHDKMQSPDMKKLQKNTDFDPFALVLDVDETAPKLFGLIKAAEGPHHNELKKIT